MALTIKHSAIATFADEPGAEINKAEWNAAHTLTGSVAWGEITGTLSGQTDLQTALDAKQGSITLTTTGSSGAATLVANTLNIPQYSGGATAFSALTSGSNTSAAMVVDSGATLAATGTGTIHATTSDALQTARAIGGVNFDGTANITPTQIQPASENSDTTCFPTFFNSASGTAQQPKYNTGLTFNASTGAFGATSFSGAGTGLTGTAASLTAGTVTTNANLTGDITSVGNATAIAAGVIVDADVNASAGILLSKTNISLTTTGTSGASTLNTTTGVLNIPQYSAGGGSGDVVGPSASVDNAIVRFDGTTGKLIQDYTSGAPTIGDTGIAAFNNNVTIAGTQIITSNASTAFAVGPAGATSPSFAVTANGTVTAGYTVFGGSGTVTMNAAGSAANISAFMGSKGSSDTALFTGGAGNVVFQPNGVTRVTLRAESSLFAPTTLATASTIRWLYTGAANSTLTGGSEFTQIKFDLAQTNQHASNTAITTQRDMIVAGMNHSFASATGTITNVGAFSVAWGNAGINTTITNNSAIYIPTQAITGTVTNAFGLNVVAPSGASNNYAALLNGNIILSSYTGILVGNGSSAVTAVTAPSGTIVGTTDTQTLTNKRVTKRVVTVNAPGATPTTNIDNCDVANFTGLGTAITSMTTNLSGTPTAFQPLIFAFTDDGTARGITWGASFEASTVALPTTTVISTLLTVGFLWNSVTSKWRCVAVA